VKVFGDIHGQYIDLMTFFYKWGQPSEGPNGDIFFSDYLFLGDYVDRGTMSLETICLLMALKIKYPNNIFLLRGNHEDRLINANFGFADECQIRLGEDPAEEDSVFNIINLFFEYLPLAAVIEDQIFCLHGGIGSSVRKISDIEHIQRPLEVVHEATTNTQQTVMDILWSDPTDFDTELGILPNTARDSNNYGNIVKFGPDIVKKFLLDNHLSYIIRAHECVLDGFERFAGGLLITVFSATDYCRRHDNAGAMLIVKNNFEIYPHLIYPPDGGNRYWIDDEETLKKRPPTPPRISYNNKGNF
jgi:protein phosphatase